MTYGFVYNGQRFYHPYQKTMTTIKLNFLFVWREIAVGQWSYGDVNGKTKLTHTQKNNNNYDYN